MWYFEHWSVIVICYHCYYLLSLLFVNIICFSGLAKSQYQVWWLSQLLTQPRHTNRNVNSVAVQNWNSIQNKTRYKTMVKLDKKNRKHKYVNYVTVQNWKLIQNETQYKTKLDTKKKSSDEQIRGHKHISQDTQTVVCRCSKLQFDTKQNLIQKIIG